MMTRPAEAPGAVDDLRLDDLLLRHRVGDAKPKASKEIIATHGDRIRIGESWFSYAAHFINMLSNGFWIVLEGNPNGPPLELHMVIGAGRGYWDAAQ